MQTSRENPESGREQSIDSCVIAARLQLIERKLTPYMVPFFRSLVFFCWLSFLALAQSNLPDSAGALKSNFAYVNRKVLAMAEAFPADKYDYRLKPEMRSFGAVIVHIASGNVYAGKAGKGQDVQWTEMNGDDYKTKAQCIDIFKKSVAEADAAIAANPLGPKKNLEPFLSVLQHASEHYGLLVAYFRANGMKPPETKDKQ